MSDDVNEKTDDKKVDAPAPTNKTSILRKIFTAKRVILIAYSVFAIFVLICVFVFASVRWQVQPFYDYFFKPDMSVLAPQPAANTPPPSESPGEDVEHIPGNENEPENEEEELPERKDDVFTFLVLGIDLHGNTDVIMVATFDAIALTLEVVSIPRDTIVNVPWNLKKVNSIHGQARNKFRGQNVASDDIAQETFDHFRNLLGYNLDFMITISMGAFPRIVDAIGGVEFDVPRSVSLEGVHVSRGVRRLTGRQALAVMRDRNAHPNGDIGRATAQQNFLLTVMRQFLDNRDSIKVTEMVGIFLTHANTNIKAMNLVWLGDKFLEMDKNDINFYMMPGDFESLRGNFYISVDLEPWLELVNEKLSPLNREITKHDVSILTRGPDRLLYVTDGNYQGDPSWGGSGTGSRNPQSTTGDRINREVIEVKRLIYPRIAPTGMTK